VVLTGAGMSAESGVPTFRGESGLWRSYRPEELATPEAFSRDPLLVWEWYAWRRGLIAACEPNPGHTALARFMLRPSRTTTLVTQNVDGLHTRALERAHQEEPTGGGGLATPGEIPEGARAIEVHGTIAGDRCSECHLRSAAVPVDLTSVDTLPRCTECGGLLRPDVVWFGEALDEAVLSAAFEAAGNADVCLVAGTSAVVHPAASVPLATLHNGGDLIEVNPESTPLSRHARVRLAGPSGEVLPALLDPLG